MRYFILLLLIAFISTSANGQNYYVAVVHGQVYYKEKLLKKRDKVTLGEEIRFSSNEDYIKLSGPGGLYRLQPGINSDGDYEFLIALRNELFPQVRLHATIGHSMVSCQDCYFLPYKAGSFTFFEQHVFYWNPPPLNEGEELGYIHQTSEGLFYRTAEIIDSSLVLKKTDFARSKRKSQMEAIQETFIVHVYDKPAFLETLSKYDNLEDLKYELDKYHSLSFIQEVFSEDEEGNPEYQEIQYPAMILDEMGPTRFIRKKDLIKDLKFHIKRSDAINVEQFLYDYEYEEYIQETYGNTIFWNMDEIWEKLDLEYNYTDSVDPID